MNALQEAPFQIIRIMNFAQVRRLKTARNPNPAKHNNVRFLFLAQNNLALGLMIMSGLQARSGRRDGSANQALTSFPFSMIKLMSFVLFSLLLKRQRCVAELIFSQTPVPLQVHDFGDRKKRSQELSSYFS
jgi:hypothetical protein